MDKIEFKLGERKKIEGKVTLLENKKASFNIVNATYELLLDDVISQNGVCVIDNTNKSFHVLLQPTDAGRYILVFTYAINDEILKDKVMVNVYD